jgi:hypothetical protein
MRFSAICRRYSCSGHRLKIIQCCEQGIVSAKDQEIIFFKTQVCIPAPHAEFQFVHLCAL